MAYTQFCAGTDTIYVPTMDDPDHQKAQAAGYDYFETLSKVFDGLSGPSSIPNGYEAATTKTTLLAAEKPQAQFVNGPETRGSDVGACIANNLLGALEALARGETTINLVGHSRGAVAAMMVTHELDALLEPLRKGQQPDPSIYDALLKTPCPYTRAAVQAQRAKFEALSSTTIYQTLQKATVNLFAIDPVPGGSILGLGGWVAWKDPRFYQLPPIVKKARVVVYNNEHTRCFKPIVPMASPETELIVLNMSGHHGTGSGNLKAQDRTLAGFDPEKTKCAQSLMLSQITHFLKENGMDFNKAHSSEVEITPEAQKQLYDEIVRNRAHFAKFDQTSYPFLSQEQGFWGLAPSGMKDWFGVEKRRIIHYQGPGDTYLSQVFPTIDGLENLEHVQHELRVTFDLVSDTTDDPATILKNFHQKLLSFSSASNRDTDECLRHIQHPMFDRIFQTLIQHIAQKYIRNHLSLEQRTDLVGRIFDFCLFLRTRPELEAKLAQVKNAIVTTIEARQNALFQVYDDLMKPPASEERDGCVKKSDALLSLRNELVEFKKGIEQFQHALPSGIDLSFDPTKLSLKCLEIDNAIRSLSEKPLRSPSSSNEEQGITPSEDPMTRNEEHGITPGGDPMTRNEEHDITPGGDPMTRSESVSTADSTITPYRRTASQNIDAQHLENTSTVSFRRSSLASSIQNTAPRGPKQNRFSASFLLAVIGGLTAGAGLIALACMLLPPVGLVTMSVALAYAFSGVGFAAGTSLLGFFGYHTTKACKATPQHEGLPALS